MTSHPADRAAQAVGKKNAAILAERFKVDPRRFPELTFEQAAQVALIQAPPESGREAASAAGAC